MPIPKSPVSFDTVKRVIDGDTIVLTGGQRVRYIGIDAPELPRNGRRGQAFGQEATERNRALVEGKRVMLVSDRRNRDRFGRILRYVYLGDTMINLVLVREGWARARRQIPNVRHAQKLRHAMQKARKEKIGIWQPSAPIC